MRMAISGPIGALAVLLAAVTLFAGLSLTGCDDDNGPEINECTLTLQQPNGGEAWTVGDSVAILWTAGEHCGHYVRLDLLQDGDSCQVIADSLAAAAGTFDWVAVACAADSAGYAVRVTDLATGVSDLSDATFLIATPSVCTLTVIAPNGGEYLVPGSAVGISWETDGPCGATVTLELLRDGSPCLTLASAMGNSGGFWWTVTKCGTATAGYAVRVTDDESGASDESDETFAITSEIPLDYMLDQAKPGTANGYSFARVVDLDPYAHYFGGATISEDTCIHGHGAWIDLSAENLNVIPVRGRIPPRFDIDHCIITHGSTSEPFGGAIQYHSLCYGWVFHNTFFANWIPAVYLHDLVPPYEEGMRIFHNIFAENGSCGAVVNDNQIDEIWIHYNCSAGHVLGNFCRHCACPEIGLRGLTAPFGDFFLGNFEDNPLFINTNPRYPLNLNLRPESPCIGAGENGEDLGALPFEPGAR